MLNRRTLIVVGINFNYSEIYADSDAFNVFDIDHINNMSVLILKVKQITYTNVVGSYNKIKY